jgi:toxin ParE1/3/4
VKVAWSPEAKSDLAAIHHYYAGIDPDFALTAAERAVRAARLLAERPSLGPAVENTLYRKWRVPRTPYILVYRIARDRLRIARVFHVAQDWYDLL